MSDFLGTINIPRTSYDALIKDSTKLEIVKALVKANSDNYMNVKDIKTILGIEEKGEENGNN